MDQDIQMTPWPEDEKEPILRRIKAMLVGKGYLIIDEAPKKPWGGEFVIDESQIEQFIREFFPEKLNLLDGTGRKLSPKILIAGEGYPLSWQDHERRAEDHRVIEGVAGYFLSDTDVQPEEPSIQQKGSLIFIPQGKRHRFYGVGGHCVVAEIWEHTNPADPSGNGDVRRISDAFKASRKE